MLLRDYVKGIRSRTLAYMQLSTFISKRIVCELRILNCDFINSKSLKDIEGHFNVKELFNIFTVLWTTLFLVLVIKLF